MNTLMIGASVLELSLPEDPVRKSQLRKKMDEYLFRLKVPLYDHTETTYKIAVLNRLLNAGSVNPVALATELAADPTKHFDHAHFYNAVAVIASYCKDGGETAIGGTGLPKMA